MENVGSILLPCYHEFWALRTVKDNGKSPYRLCNQDKHGQTTYMSTRSTFLTMHHQSKQPAILSPLNLRHTPTESYIIYRKRLAICGIESRRDLILTSLVGRHRSTDARYGRWRPPGRKLQTDHHQTSTDDNNTWNLHTWSPVQLQGFIETQQPRRHNSMDDRQYANSW